MAYWFDEFMNHAIVVDIDGETVLRIRDHYESAVLQAIESGLVVKTESGLTWSHRQKVQLMHWSDDDDELAVVIKEYEVSHP